LIGRDQATLEIEDYQYSASIPVFESNT
jgi:hypothetical protein